MISIANQSAYYVNALKKCKTDIAKSIIDLSEFRLSIKDKHGWNAAFYAIIYNNIEILYILINKKKLDVNSVDYKGYSLLMIAAKYNKYNIVKLLIKNGANINKYHTGSKILGYYCTPNYSTAYSIARDNNYRNIVNLLIILGADITLTDRYLKTVSLFEDKDEYNFCKLDNMRIF